MKKRLFTILLTAFVVAALAVLFCATAAAETREYNGRQFEVQTEGDYQYIVIPRDAIPEKDTDLGVIPGAYITKYTGTLQSSIAIPAKLGGHTVVQIGYQSFKGNNAIQTVTIGSSVRSINTEAFMDCSGLQTVLISKEVTWLIKSCFQNCTALKSVTFEKGSKLKEIGPYVFYNCASLNNFSIPEGVETIGEVAFCACQSMVSIKVPDSVTALGNKVFFGCKSLREATVGNGVTVLPTRVEWSGDDWGTHHEHDGCFEGCISLTKITLGSGLTTIERDCFAGTGLLDVTLPDNVKYIGPGAFCNCSSLKKFHTGNGVETIDWSAFVNDTALETFVTGSGVQRIASGALENATSLVNVTIGKSVITIEDIAFRNCNSLKSIIIPSNVTNLGGAAFFSCDSLETAVIGNGVTDLRTRVEWSGENWGTHHEQDGCFEGCVNLKSISIGSGVRTIGVDCFAGTALTNVTIPDNVITMNACAFINCQSLKKIVIGKGVTSMGWGMFYDDNALTDVTIGSGVVTIGDMAFLGCDALETIYIPSNVTTLGNKMFFSCSNLKTAVIGNGVTELPSRVEWSGENWGSHHEHDGCFEGCVSLTSVTLGSGLIAIGRDCFAGTQIETLTVPYKVSTLAYGAFFNASKLKDVYFVGNWAANAGGDLFGGCAEECTIHYINGRVGYDDLGYNKKVFSPITVTFSNNSDDVFAAPTEEQILAPAGGYVIEPISPTALGYLFDGWYKDKACTQKWDFTKDKVSKDTTLYAKWNSVDSVVPVRPENVTTDNILGKSITLHWSDVDGAKSYNVYVNGKKVNTDKITDTSYTVKGLTPATTYEFEVTAVNTKGESERSLIVAERTDSHVHTPGDEVRENEVPATCETDGSYDSVYYCTGCEAEMSRTPKTIPATGHKFGEWTTYNTEEHIRYCENDVSHTETAPHKWNKGKVTTEPTCSQKGLKTFTCTVCKQEKTEEIEENPNNHADYETHVENLQPATCTDKGYSGDTICNACGKIVKKGEDIEATGHSWGKWQDDGEQQHARFCANDETHVEREDHNWGKGTVTKPATTTETGEKTYICSVCGREKVEEIPMKTESDEEDFMLGDVNFDGKIDSADARLALRRSVMLENYPEGSKEFRACDVTVDGKVEPTDARLILRAGVGLEDYTKWGK